MDRVQLIHTESNFPRFSRLAALHSGTCSADCLTVMRVCSSGSMPLHCWVYIVVAKTCFDNLRILFYFCTPFIWINTVSFFLAFHLSLRCAWQFLHGKYAPVSLFFFFFCFFFWFGLIFFYFFIPTLCFCVFVMENPFSQSLCFDFSISSLTSSVVPPLCVQSSAAMLFTVILH